MDNKKSKAFEFESQSTDISLSKITSLFLIWRNIFWVQNKEYKVDGQVFTSSWTHRRSYHGDRWSWCAEKRKKQSQLTIRLSNIWLTETFEYQSLKFGIQMVLNLNCKVKNSTSLDRFISTKDIKHVRLIVNVKRTTIQNLDIDSG